MALPIVPIAGFALRYGLVALAGAALAKRSLKTKTDKDIHREHVMDRVPNGIDAHRVEGDDEVQIEGSHGGVHRIWLGERGVEIDSRLLARLRIRKLNGKDE